MSDSVNRKSSFHSCSGELKRVVVDFRVCPSEFLILMLKREKFRDPFLSTSSFPLFSEEVEVDGVGCRGVDCDVHL